jgi:hypothetical protein
MVHFNEQMQIIMPIVAVHHDLEIVNSTEKILIILER